VETPQRRRLLLLAAAAIAAVVVVAVAVAISQGGEEDGGGGSTSTAKGTDAEVRALFAGIPQKGTSLGDPDAPATLIEFADLQCPFCAQFATESLPTVIRRYVRTGRLRLELRLLTFLGPDSVRGAQVAAAAAQQDRMWPFAELFYRNQGAENSGYATDDFLEGLARQTPGLDVDQVAADISTPASKRVIRDARVQGEALGVDSTPSFFVRRNGGPARPMTVQALDAATFTSTLDQALEGG
jgi:protein-disulfide isomerase